jgi:kynurenine formamidase
LLPGGENAKRGQLFFNVQRFHLKKTWKVILWRIMHLYIHSINFLNHTWTSFDLTPRRVMSHVRRVLVKVIDLTHLIQEAMPVYPGTEPPVLEPANTLERDGFREKKLHMYSHTGTHMDAPAHMIESGSTLDQRPADAFFGKAVKIDVRHLEIIERADLEPFLDEGAEFVLLWTGWDTRWGTESYFNGFPTLSIDAAKWLADKPIKGVGVDAISVDSMAAVDFEVHMALLGHDKVLIENLCSLERLPQSCLFSAMPLKLVDADGSPIRAYALLEGENDN